MHRAESPGVSEVFLIFNYVRICNLQKYTMKVFIFYIMLSSQEKVMKIMTVEDVATAIGRKD